MIKQAANYADFKAVANGLGVTPTVFFYDSGASYFYLCAFDSTKAFVELSLGASLPGSFTLDFSTRIALTAPLI